MDIGWLGNTYGAAHEKKKSSIHVQLHSGARDLNFGRSLHQLKYFMQWNNGGSFKNANVQAHLYQNLVCCPTISFEQFTGPLVEPLKPLETFNLVAIL